MIVTLLWACFSPPPPVPDLVLHTTVPSVPADQALLPDAFRIGVPLEAPLDCSDGKDRRPGQPTAYAVVDVGIEAVRLASLPVQPLQGGLTATSEPLLPELFDALMTLRDGHRTAVAQSPECWPEFEGRLLLAVHPDVPAQTVAQVVYTAGQAEFGALYFAVESATYPTAPPVFRPVALEPPVDEHATHATPAADLTALLGELPTPQCRDSMLVRLDGATLTSLGADHSGGRLRTGVGREPFAFTDLATATAHWFDEGEAPVDLVTLARPDTPLRQLLNLAASRHTGLPDSRWFFAMPEGPKAGEISALPDDRRTVFTPDTPIPVVALSTPKIGEICPPSQVAEPTGLR